MGLRIDQLRDDLRLKLLSVDVSFNKLTSKIDGKTHDAEEAIRGYLEQVQRRIEQDRAKVLAAQAKVNSWVTRRRITSADKVTEWKVNRDLCKLQNRAYDAEQYAAAALNVAPAAVDDAEQAALEAWLARQDEDSAVTQRTAGPIG